MAKKTVRSEMEPQGSETTTEAAPVREREFPQAVINITVTLSGTSALTDEALAQAISLDVNEEAAVTVASVEKALKGAISAAAKSGTLKLRRAKSTGNLVASLPIKGALVTVCPKGTVEKRTEEDRQREALAAFGL